MSLQKTTLMRSILASAHVETQFIASYLLRHSLRLIYCVTHYALSIELPITPYLLHYLLHLIYCITYYTLSIVIETHHIHYISL